MQTKYVCKPLFQMYWFCRVTVGLIWGEVLKIILDVIIISTNAILKAEHSR